MEEVYNYFNRINSSEQGLDNESAGWLVEDYRYDWPVEPIRDPLYVVIPISIIYALIFITGMVGNVSTCIVIARNKSMHTATNYYLFSLAVSDLLLLILGMPVEIYQVWYKYPYAFGEVFCVLRGLAAETSTNASVLTITAFTIERYVAICHPFLSQTMSKLTRAVKLILVIWIIALLSAIPQAVQFGLVSLPHRPELTSCSLKRVIFEDSFIVATVVFFAVPLLLLSVLYVMIGIKLKKSNLIKKNYKKQEPQQRKRTSSTQQKASSTKMDKHCRQHSKSTRRVIKMLVAVVVTFFVCWAPFHVQRLIATIEKQHQQSQLLYLVLTYVSGIFYYFSTTVNPILYNIMSNKFREAFMETLARSCKISRFMIRHERRSYSSLSRSQLRNPVGLCPSKTTGLTVVGTAVAQESTDCSGNSLREEMHQYRQMEISISDTPPSVLCNGHDKDSLNKDVSIEMGGKVPVCNNGTLWAKDLPFGSSANAELASRDTTYPMQNSTEKQQQQRTTTKLRSSKKKWWRLLNWLPGLKSIQAARSRSNELDDQQLSTFQPPTSQPHAKDYYMQLRTFATKEESCRPV